MCIDHHDHQQFFFFFSITHVYWPSKYQSKDNHRTVLLLATIFFNNKIIITQVYWPSWPLTIFFFFKCITQVYWPSKYQSKDNHRTVLLLATIFFFNKINITQVYWPSWPIWPSTIFFFLNVLHKCIDHQNIKAKTINEQCFFLRRFFF